MSRMGRGAGEGWGNQLSVDIGARQPALDGQVEVAPVLLVHVCGLPASVLDGLATLDTMAVLRRVRSRRAAAGQLAPMLANDLYALVPRLGRDRELRWTALSLRRDVYNRRWTPATARAADRIAALLPPAAAARLHQWTALAREAAGVEAEADEVLAAEVAGSGEIMLATLRDPTVLRGVALSSPSFAARLARSGPDETELGSRLARTAVSYLTRSAAKTRPFSTLTTVGLAVLDRPWPAGSDRFWEPARGPADLAAAPRRGAAVATEAGDREALSPRALAVELLRACAAHPGLAGAFLVAGPRDVREVGPRRLASLPLYAYTSGAFVRDDELTDCRSVDGLLGTLPRDPEPLRAVAGRLGTGGDALARRLVETGLLRPVTPWRATDGRYFRALAEAVTAVAEGPPDATDAADAAGIPTGLVWSLEALAEAEERFAAQPPPDPLDIVAADGAVRDAARSAFAALGRPAPSWLGTAPLFAENVAHAGTEPVLTARVRDALGTVARHAAPHVVRSAVYDRLVDHFVGQFGTGGICRDVLGFLYGFLSHPGVPDLLRAEASGAARAADGGTGLTGHGTLAPASHSVFFQLTAERLVVNRLDAGAGGLLARWAGVPALHERLATTLRDWVGRLHPGCRVLQVADSADWSSAARARPGLLPRLRWPSELPARGASAGLSAGVAAGAEVVAGDGMEDEVDAAALVLAHDQATGTLQAQDGSGRPVGFVNLGVTPRQAMAAPLRLLLTLSDPWLTVGRIDQQAVDAPRPAGVVSHVPRLERGPVVFARARWLVPVDLLPRPGREERPAHYFGRLDAWRLDHGIPEEVFWQPVLRGGSAQPAPKPRWVGLVHPHAVWAALRALPPATAAVELVEALPARTEHWYRDPEGRPRAAELVALVRHA